MSGLWLLSFILLPNLVLAQSSIQKLFDQKMQLPEHGEPGLEMLRMSESFLGTPYIAHSLEINATEKLVCKLDGLDCTTLVENAVALIVAKEQDHSYDSYRNELKKLRYRNGVIEGYPSRLHYVLDWMYENEKRGRLQNITASIGGIPFEKEINFMSNHADLYPALTPTEVWKKIKKQEEIINNRKHTYIPKAEIMRVEALLKNGDIVAFTSTVEGLDCNHMGVISKMGSRAYLIHASLTDKKVILSKVPLAEYTASVAKHSGIIVARLNAITNNE